MNFHNIFSEPTMIRAISAFVFDDYTIQVSLEGGRVVKMDMHYLKNITVPVVDPLKDPKAFQKVFVRNGIVTWQTGYDIDPYYLIEAGVVVGNNATGS